MTENSFVPLLAHKHHDSPSAFTPESLLREARRQKAIGAASVPEVCVLDPDGDIVRRMTASGHARRHDGWACYHTTLHVITLEGHQIGIVGCAVGAPFAVLVAEEMFASGCQLLVSITSSGQLRSAGTPPYFILIDRALRDEGTSYHYLPASRFCSAAPAIIAELDGAFDDMRIAVLRGATWTTDAPFRETQAAIAAMRDLGLMAVEMEAAALYAFAEARGKRVVCFAHVTNQMGTIDGDFEKGPADGATDALAIVSAAADRLHWGKRGA